MARTSYGKNMAASEHHQDEINWKRNFDSAVYFKDYSEIKTLLKEAINFGYSIPEVSDQEVLSIIAKVVNESKKG